MVSHFDPRTGADRSVAYSRVTHPVSPSGITPTRPKTLQASRTTMQALDQEVAEFEIKYAKRVDEDAKILALKSIMPETLSVKQVYSEGDHSVLTQNFAHPLSGIWMTKYQCL